MIILGFSFYLGKAFKTRLKKKAKLLFGCVESCSWTQATICNGPVILCSGLRNAPLPIQLQALSQSPTGATIAWRFPQADEGSPPNRPDQGRASELSCGRGTELYNYEIPSQSHGKNVRLRKCLVFCAGYFFLAYLIC